MDDTATLDSSNFTHLSTWVLFQSLPSSVPEALYDFCGEEVMPIQAKVRYGGEETMVSVYSNLTVNKFIMLMAEHAGIGEEKLVVKLVEDTVTKKLDKKRTHKNKEGEEIESTLKDLKMCHNANILLDE